jgi:predicted DNA-binding transcriptional regulator AlpA
MNLLTTKDLAAIFKLSERQVADRTVHLPDFPPARKIGGARRWVEAEIMEWINVVSLRGRKPSRRSKC